MKLSIFLLAVFNKRRVRWPLTYGCLAANYGYTGRLFWPLAVGAPRGGSVTIDGREASVTDSGTPSEPGGAVMMDGTGNITVRQGTLSGNRGALGGAVYCAASPLEGEYSLQLLGGSITGNTANDGGGIWAEQFQMSGGLVADNRAVWGGARSGQGGGIFIRREAESADVKSEETNLLLTGGTISGNTAEGVGGGLTLSWGTNSVISGNPGNPVQITGNRAEAKAPDTAGVPHVFGGGGIFIEHRAGKHNTSNRYGSLRIQNVLVTDNTASYGGGIGLCSDGSLGIFEMEGASVYGNHITGEVTKDQLNDEIKAGQEVQNVSKDILGDTIYSIDSGVISGKMLGDDLAHWSGLKNSGKKIETQKGEDVKNPLTFGLTNLSSGTAAGAAAAGCIISGNSSRTGGGGIGGNGGFTAGYDPNGNTPALPSSAPSGKTLSLRVNKTAVFPDGTDTISPSAPTVFTFTISQDASDAHKAIIPVKSITVGPLEPGGYHTGAAAFKDISFPDDGTYNFVIREDTKNLAPFWEQEGTAEWNVRVEVTTENGEQIFSAPLYTPAGQAGSAQYTAAGFVNRYTARDTFEPKVYKHLVDPGKKAQNETFTFVLSADEGTPMPAGASATENGLQSIVRGVWGGTEASFGKITYTEEDLLENSQQNEFTYTIREIAEESAADGMIFDEAVWTLKVHLNVEGNNGAAVIAGYT